MGGKVFTLKQIKFDSPKGTGSKIWFNAFGVEIHDFPQQMNMMLKRQIFENIQNCYHSIIKANTELVKLKNNIRAEA